MTTLSALVAAARAPDERVVVPAMKIRHVCLRTGGRWFAVPAAAVVEVVPLPDVTRLPAAPAHLLGVAMVRARLTAIVDLDVMVAGRRTPRLERGRAVLVRSGELELALVATETRGLIPFPPAAATGDDAAPDPDPASRHRAGRTPPRESPPGPERPAWVAREERLDGELYAVIDVARLIDAALPGAA